MFRRMLIAHDDSVSGARAFNEALELARRLDAAQVQADAVRVKFEAHLISGHPVQAICDHISANRFDLLAIGYIGHMALYNCLISRTADQTRAVQGAGGEMSVAIANERMRDVQ
jgi:nucleotide-binding universal stress UspA family protein